VAIVHPWYQRRIWRDKLRPAVLRKDPMCAKCGVKPSTHADHIIPFSTGKTEQEQWDLFTDLENNLQGLCTEDHSRKTSTTDGGFGHRLNTPDLSPVLTVKDYPVEVKYCVSSLPPEVLDRALRKADQS
jgi:5-methylcytosine-specific restriction endonuclease McrA